MDSFDFDINNYSIKDIENFLKLKKNYTFSDVELNQAKIREQLLNSSNINKKHKRDLIIFLENAKKILINVKFQDESFKPTTIPKNDPLDKSNYPYQKPSLPYLREGDLINRENLQFIHTKTEDFVPGYLNPLNTRVITKCLTIDTRFRDNLSNTQSSDFTIQLPFKLNKVVSSELLSFELPIQFYRISSSYGNNFFFIEIDYLNEYDTSDNKLYHTGRKQVIIPDGNYNSYDLLNTINIELAKHGDLFLNISFSLNITDTCSGTNKIIIKPDNNITNIQNITIDFSRDIDGNHSNVDITTRLGWNLGFINKIYTGFIKYVSDSVLEPSSIKYVYLSVEDFNNSMNNVFVSAFDKIILDTNILARINMKNENIVSEKKLITEPRKYFGPVDIQRLRIRLFDEHGRIMHMNDTNYSFCLLFKLMYDL